MPKHLGNGIKVTWLLLATLFFTCVAAAPFIHRILSNLAPGDAGTVGFILIHSCILITQILIVIRTSIDILFMSLVFLVLLIWIAHLLAVDSRVRRRYLKIVGIKALRRPFSPSVAYLRLFWRRFKNRWLLLFLISVVCITLAVVATFSEDLGDALLSGGLSESAGQGWSVLIEFVATPILFGLFAIYAVAHVVGLAWIVGGLGLFVMYLVAKRLADGEEVESDV